MTTAKVFGGHHERAGQREQHLELRRKNLKVEPLDPSVVGFRVVAIDGQAGRIANLIDEMSSSYLVVSLGWFFRKTRLVPVNVVKSVDSKQRKLFLTWTEAQVKQA